MDHSTDLRVSLESAAAAGDHGAVREHLQRFLTAMETEALQDQQLAGSLEDAGDMLCRFGLFCDAKWAYQRAEQWFAGFASAATSGGEGAARMLEVERVQRKLRAPEGTDPRHMSLTVSCRGRDYGMEELDDLRWMLDEMRQFSQLPDDLLTSGLKLLATATSSPLSRAVLDFLQAVGPHYDLFPSAVLREFSQENYALLCKSYPAAASWKQQAQSWEEWERQWEPSQQDWPIAELVFQLDSRSKVLHMMSQAKAGLAPSNESVSYFLLCRLAKEPQADLAVLAALAALIRNSASDHRKLLRERAAVLYRRIWNQCPHKELEQISSLAGEWERMRSGPFDGALAG